MTYQNGHTWGAQDTPKIFENFRNSKRGIPIYYLGVALNNPPIQPLESFIKAE